MKLRNLEEKDALRMLQWMHDPFVVDKLQTDFSCKTIDDCLLFIEDSLGDDHIHLAIVDDEDTYMGTVSLKHITKNTAEFAITVHSDAMGKGYSLWAMKEMLNKGFRDYGVDVIYWCVATNNHRALRFYDKNGFKRIDSKDIVIVGGYTKEQIDSYIWYREDNG